MKVGVLSDTHGQVSRVQQALEVFDGEGVEAIFHCGDVGGLAVLEQFVGRRLFFVWGNVDWPDPSWRKVLEDWNLPWPEPGPGGLRVDLAGRAIALAHGHEPRFAELRRGSGIDFLFRGHTHQRELTRTKRSVVVNPGAIYQGSPCSVAVVDLASADVRFFDLHGAPLCAGR